MTYQTFFFSLELMRFIAFFLPLSLIAFDLWADLIVYSSRKEKFVRPLLDKFERETKIKTKLLSGVKVIKILEEQRYPLGNVFISNDVGQLEFLRLKGALKGIDIRAEIGISQKFRAKDNSWVGLTARSRILMYNTDLISQKKMPKTLWDLTLPQWKGQFAITSGGNSSMIAHIGALRSTWGEKKTLEWMKKVKENAGAITKGHTDIRMAVGRGEFKFGLVNNYYYHLQKLEKKHNRVAAVYPDQGGMGTFTNSAGVALLNNPKNFRESKAFMRWIVEKENQKLFAHASLEVPLNPALKAPKEAKAVHQYKTLDMALDTLGKNWPKSKKLIERAGLDLAVK
ncbi:MAG: extracellular solute-binding protein [Bacteriovoracales bacterium]|nr:extracellular solute-binding protein [Bacteriovoracales bacterium]